MHELALAGAIVEIAERHARGRRVTRVELEVGSLRQVVSGALAFSFDLVARGTPVEGAELVLVDVSARLECRACGEETHAEAFPLTCSSCGSLDVEVTGGEQLDVVALELEDEPLAAAGEP